MTQRSADAGSGGVQMEVRLLGPVRVGSAGDARTVGRAAERAVLALLALQPGTVVAATRLMDALWGSDLPDDPANALQTRVSKLRRALAAAGMPAAAVVTRAPGYLLAVEPTAVDAHRAVRLIEEARRATSADPARAERLYADALALWHGEALEEFGDADWAQPERVRLAELRLAAIEERIELLLAAGRHGEVLGDLERLVAEHPLRERLRVQLMVVLYRAGRQADALKVYEQTRRVLAEELGLDPSPQLAALQAAVLRGDPALAAPADEWPSASAPERPRASAPVPARLTSFVGRDEELALVTEMCIRHRLVTLTGPGGAGKTSLATEAARAVADRFPDGVVLVHLAGVREADRVRPAVADALRLASDLGGAIELDERLKAELTGRHLLLLLDNCEHVIDSVAELVERLLIGCPDLHVLAASREALAVAGEVQLPTRPLPVPEPPAAVAALAENPAVRLFCDRAAAVDPFFVLDERTAGAVATVCRQLDGLPLALELAAARVSSLSVADLAARLGDRFSVLTVGTRTSDARHRTLRATVEWSHDLLDVNEQTLFRRLAVFRGGWTLDAAEAVCADAPLDAGQILDVLTKLVARSMVVAEPARGRFRMLETLRVFADERLVAAGEADRVADQHALHVLALAEEAAPKLRSGAQHAWLQRLADERDNIDAVLGRVVGKLAGDPDPALRLVGALGWWWYFGRHDEGRTWTDRALAGSGRASPPARAAAHQAAALVWRPGGCLVHPSDRCAAAAAESLAAAKAAGDAQGAAYAKLLLAVEGVSGVGTAESLRLLDDAEDVLGVAGDEWGLAMAAFVRAEIGFKAQSMPFETAEALARRAAAAFGRLGDGWGRSAVLGHHGGALRLAGRVDEALVRYEETIEIARNLGLLLTLQWIEAEMGYCALLLGDEERALRLCSQAEVATDRLGTGPGRAFATLVRAAVDRRRGDLNAARAGSVSAARQLRAAGIGWVAATAWSQAGAVAELSGDLPAAEEFQREALTIGLAEAPVALPAALEGLASVAAAEGDARWAATLLGTATAVRERTGRRPDALEQSDLDRVIAAARGALGSTAFDELHSSGQRLDPAEAAARPVRAG